MAYTREQRRNIAIAQRLSRGHTRREVEALLEAMAVESNFRHVGYGDRDSLGVLQQRPSQGWGRYNPKDPSEDIRQFLERSSALERKGFKGTSGQLAQAVQRSAFPGRYDERADEIRKLLAAGPSSGPPAAGGATIPPEPARAAGALPDTSAIRNDFARSLIGPQTRPLQERLLELAVNLRGAESRSPVSGPPAAGVVPPARDAPARAGGQADPGKWVQVPGRSGQWPGPGREILSFTAAIAQSYGRPLRAWDTSTHSRMTTSGRVSAHTTGDALDIPAAGARLTRLGRIALIQAGMPRAQAMKQTGGLFNVGGYQIIFNTNEGGNHHDHLHVGRRRSR